MAFELAYLSYSRNRFIHILNRKIQAGLTVKTQQSNIANRHRETPQTNSLTQRLGQTEVKTKPIDTQVSETRGDQLGDQHGR